MGEIGFDWNWIQALLSEEDSTHKFGMMTTIISSMTAVMIVIGMNVVKSRVIVVRCPVGQVVGESRSGDRRNDAKRRRSTAADLQGGPLRSPVAVRKDPPSPMAWRLLSHTATRNEPRPRIVTVSREASD